MGAVPFTQGLHELPGGGYAWIQPDGGWGWSNAGLVVGQGESLLVDTLFDVPHTARMLDAMAPVVGDRPIRSVFNTHSNGDHWYGNELLPDNIPIVASARIHDEPPGIRTMLSMIRTAKAHQPASARLGEGGAPTMP